MTPPSVLIVGAGIGGLSAAIALRRAGCAVALYERADGFGDVGAGLTLTPPALRALDALGVLAPTLAASDNVASTAFIDHARGDLLRLSESREVPGAAGVDETRVIHRSDMHAILLDAALAAGVALHGGQAMIEVAQDANTAHVTFADGRRAGADLVIACDGLRSVARQRLRGGDPPRDIGLVAYRAVVPCAALGDALDGHASAVHIGPGATFVRYALRHGELMNCVAIVQTDAPAADSWSTPATHAELLAHFSGWSASLHAIIARIPAGSLYKWPLFDRDPIARWAFGRIALLGDAAHPMLPFLGIGAAMGIEDAVVLGRAIASAATPQDGLLAYQAARIDRATEVTLASRRQAELMLGAGAADRFRRELPTSDTLAYDVRRT